ncbi:hypothetical protein, partial [Enterobacter asburiae]
APWPVDSPKSTGAAEMSTSTIEGLATAWATIADESELPPPVSYTQIRAHQTSRQISSSVFFN